MVPDSPWCMIRDVLTNPHKGYYLNISQCFRPKFMGNDYAFSTTDLRTSYYHPVWKGGLLAGEFRGCLILATRLGQ